MNTPSTPTITTTNHVSTLVPANTSMRRVPRTLRHHDTGLPHGVSQPENLPGLWVARINLFGKRVHLGVYASEAEAYAARRGALALRDLAEFRLMLHPTD